MPALRNRSVAGLLAVLIGAGCAPAQLQLISNPLGALIIENDTGKTYRAPANVLYALTNKDRDSSSCYLVKGYTAVWQSGATAVSPKTIQLCGAGPIWNYRFERPASAPNLALDLNVQNQVIASEQQKAELQRYLAASFIRGLTGGSTVVVPPVIEPTRTAVAPAPASQNPTLMSQPSSLPRMAPDGTYVPGGDRPITLCPNGTYVAGRCSMAPDGTYVGQ